MAVIVAVGAGQAGWGQVAGDARCHRGEVWAAMILYEIRRPLRSREDFVVVTSINACRLNELSNIIGE